MHYSDNKGASPAAADLPCFPAELLVEAAFCQNQVGLVISRADDGVIVELNDAWLEIIEQRREAVIGHRLAELDLTLTMAGREIGWDRLFAGEPASVEVAGRKKSGTAKACMAQSSQISYNGQTYYITSMLDISERKQAMAKAEESRLLFELFFYEAPTPMLVLAADDFRVINANKAWTALTGQTRCEFHGQKIDGLTAMLTQAAANGVTGDLPADSFLRGEFEFTTKSKEARYGRAQIRPVAMAGRKCYLAAIEDITDRRIAEREYSRLSGLNLVGEIAASIGHEVRNPMTTVRGYLQLMVRRPELAEYHQRFDMMIGELDRANHILTEFLSVVKDRKNNREIINLNEIIASLYPIIQASAAMEEKELAFDPGVIRNHYLDPKEMRQLILNLVKNGLEAMPPKGVVTIKTWTNGRGETVLTVKDQGSGIPAEIRQRVGQPFFTTKEGGTGLGLAVCYSIARRNGGRISIVSGRRGTTVKVIFPPENIKKKSSAGELIGE